jgi:hypothetical protein
MISEIIGAILIGDGFVCKRGSICFRHSVVQEEYALWKKQRLIGLGVKFQKDKYDEPHGFGRNRVIDIRSSSTSNGKRLRDRFYPDGKKKIPSDVFKGLGWEGWAIVFQDDGRCNRISHYNTIKNGIRVRVECEPFVNRYEFCFPMFDDREMQDAIDSLSALGVNARIGFHRRLGQRLLWITEVKSKDVFRRGVLPYMCECLKYKTELRPSLGAVS